MKRVSADGERGSVTAEFVVVVPAIVMVLVLCLLAMQATTRQVRLQDAAADAARSLARGDDASAASALANSRVAGAVLASETRGDLECVTLTAPGGAAGGVLQLVSLTAGSCALGGGR
ncbi:TadE family type IV pilus minor pilin [Marisediminicola sp. LYQ134]|uniref:TadE family type IV pilus minor pilin n=1 Tax=Marisediminicola sp. LYQ134 TaxID=3391061 RepID=UPI0039835BF9